jgi:hypothetical protein
MFLGLQDFWVKGRVGASRWGLGKVTKKSITHTDLHKPNKQVG